MGLPQRKGCADDHFGYGQQSCNCSRTYSCHGFRRAAEKQAVLALEEAVAKQPPAIYFVLHHACSLGGLHGDTFPCTSPTGKGTCQSFLPKSLAAMTGRFALVCHSLKLRAIQHCTWLWTGDDSKLSHISRASTPTEVNVCELANPLVARPCQIWLMEQAAQVSPDTWRHLAHSSCFCTPSL